METSTLHPMATGHIPKYVAAADGSDYLFTFMVAFTVGIVILIGVAYFTLHAIPEKLAHKSNHPQFQLVGILSLLALFTHNGLFWVAAILVAGFQFPDFSSPLRAIADAIDRNGSRDAPPTAQTSQNSETPVTPTPKVAPDA